MCLWQGYYRNKPDKIPEPILTEIPFMKFDPDQKPDLRVESVGGVYFLCTKNTILKANGYCVFADFPAEETMFSHFPHDEIQYIAKGKAEMTYSLAATSHTEQKTMNIKPGDCYIIPRGARVTWKVAPGDAMRLLCFVMPGLPPTQLNPERVKQI